MVFMEWSEKFSVRIPEIDEQHKKLVDMLNAIGEMCEGGSDARASGKALLDMMKYTKYHFTYEEEMLKIAGYPEIEAHQAHHELFTKRTYELLEKYKTQDRSLSNEIHLFLKNWLTKHILAIDGKFADFMEKRLSKA